MIKRDETKEVKRSKTLYPEIDGLYNLIDTKMILSAFGLKDDNMMTETFIDLMRDDKDDDNTYLSSDSLYPVIPSNKQFDKPYLTPRRHLEYCTFWAGAGTIGLSSMLYVLFKVK